MLLRRNKNSKTVKYKIKFIELKNDGIEKKTKMISKKIQYRKSHQTNDY